MTKPAAIYLQPSPAGAHYVVTEPEDDPLRRFMAALIRGPVTPRLTGPDLLRWTGQSEPAAAKAELREMLALGWLEALEEPRDYPSGPLEQVLSALLPPLSSHARILLADAQGFHLASHGFSHDEAEELSALSADLATLHQRHGHLLNQGQKLRGSAWAVVDVAGHSQLGFWPLFVGPQRFALAIAGVPYFNRPEMVDVAWSLYQRYGRHLDSNPPA